MQLGTPEELLAVTGVPVLSPFVRFVALPQLPSRAVVELPEGQAVLVMRACAENQLSAVTSVHPSAPGMHLIHLAAVP